MLRRCTNRKSADRNDKDGSLKGFFYTTNFKEYSYDIYVWIGRSKRYKQSSLL